MKGKYLLAIIICLLTGLTTTAQSTIKGKILTSDGQPAADVNVELKDLKLFRVTDEKGEFEFSNIKPGSYSIVATFSGLKTQVNDLVITSSQTFSVTLNLVENARELSEVIVRSKKGINDVPVTAGKVAIDPMDLPQSLAVINENVIREQQSQRLSDVVKNVNGVYLSTTRGGTQESFSARGYGFSSGNMFKNGSRINTGIMPEMSSLEKVEILKGSSAILYGNVAPGGIINMITKQPKFTRGAEVSMRLGSYGLLKPAVDVYGPVSKNIAFRINGTYEKADSYRDVVQSERFYINPSLLFRMGKKTELLLQGDYLSSDYTPDFGIGSVGNTRIADLPRSAFLGAHWQYNKANQLTATAVLKHKINNNWQVNLTSSFQQYNRDYYSTERVQALENGDWRRPLNKIESKEDYYLGQIDLTGKFRTGGIEHMLLAGFDADRYNTVTYGFDNITFYDTINVLDPNKFNQRNDIPEANKIKKTLTPVNRTGIYLQDLITLSPKFKLLAGIRWSQQTSSPVKTTNLLMDTSSLGVSKSDDAFTPRVGLVYQPTRNTSLFASYANSFSINSGTDIYMNALDPSMIDQYEAGIKNSLLKGRLNVNLTVYKIINNNLAQTAQFDATGAENNNTALKELVGQTTSNGVELDIQGEPIKGLNLITGYSYNDMRYTKTKDAKGNYIVGDRLVNTPAHTANLGGFYTLTSGKMKGLKAGVQVLFIGERVAGWNNTQGQAQNYSRQIPVDEYTTVDLSLGYTFKKATIIAKVSNLFNTYNYYVHENYSVNPIAPIQFSTTLSIKL